MTTATFPKLTDNESFAKSQARLNELRQEREQLLKEIRSSKERLRATLPLDTLAERYRKGKPIAPDTITVERIRELEDKRDLLSRAIVQQCEETNQLRGLANFDLTKSLRDEYVPIVSRQTQAIGDLIDAIQAELDLELALREAGLEWSHGLPVATTVRYMLPALREWISEAQRKYPEIA